MTWVGLVVVAAVFAGILPIADPHQYQYGPSSSSPSWHDWFGTNTGGQDLFSQVVNGARVSLIVGVSSVAAGIGIGGGLGMVAGYLRGRLDAVVVWVTDVMLTFPGLVFALALVAFLGSSLRNVVIAIAVFGIPIYVRVTRALTLTFSSREFVYAAESLGATRWRVLGREVLPNVAAPLLPYAAIGASVAIIAEGGLAFLGVSAPNSFSWGFLISQGQQELAQAPQAVLFPMVVMFLTILALNVIGDRLGATVDPRASNL